MIHCLVGPKRLQLKALVVHFLQTESLISFISFSSQCCVYPSDLSVFLHDEWTHKNAKGGIVCFQTVLTVNTHKHNDQTVFIHVCAERALVCCHVPLFAVSQQTDTTLDLVIYLFFSKMRVFLFLYGFTSTFRQSFCLPQKCQHDGIWHTVLVSVGIWTTHIASKTWSSDHWGKSKTLESRVSVFGSTQFEVVDLNALCSLSQFTMHPSILKMRP